MARPAHDTLALRDARAYIFRVLLSGKPHTFDDIPGYKDGLFTLPRHPLNVQYQAGVRTQTYATGMTDMRADQQGVDPPVIQLGVNFGEQGGYHAGTGQGLDGRQAMRSLEQFIRGYVKAAAGQGVQRKPVHVLEFHDIYKEQSWVVAPLTVPYGSEDASRPFTEDGSIRLQALTPAEHAIPPADSIPAKLRDKALMCPLNPGCKYGGPFEKGCPFRGKK